MTSEISECAEACLDVHKVCLETLKYRLSRGGAHAEAPRLLRLLDAAQLCESCAEFCIEQSEQTRPVSEACARLCESLAADCAGSAEAELRRCAQAALSCARACYRVARAPAPA